MALERLQHIKLGQDEAPVTLAAAMVVSYDLISRCLLRFRCGSAWATASGVLTFELGAKQLPVLAEEAWQVHLLLYGMGIVDKV